MTLRLTITTTKPQDLEVALEKFQNGILKHGQGNIASDWVRLKDKEFKLEIDYGLENRVSNWLVEKEITKTLKKLDPDIKIRKH